MTTIQDTRDKRLLTQHEEEAIEWAHNQNSMFMRVYSNLVAPGQWQARLSAPGYMDCTDWTSTCSSEIGAIVELYEMYGDE